MAFNPDKFLSKTKKGGFDPDKFISEIKSNQADTEPQDGFMAALEGFGKGVTAGYLPQLQAKAQPLTDRLFKAIGLGDAEPAPLSQLLENSPEYIKARDLNIKRQKEQSEQFPKTSKISEIIGGVTSAAAIPASRAAGLARLGQSVGSASIYSALSNPYDIEGVVDELQLDERLKNAVIGALTGLGAEAGLKAIEKMSKPLAENILNAAKRRAAKALGAERATARELGEEGILEVGEFALRTKAPEFEGGKAKRIISPSLFDNTKKMAQRIEQAKSGAGKKMGEVYESLDEAGIKEFSPFDVASRVESEVGDFWKSPINRAEQKQLENTIESILMRGPDKNISFKEAQKLKEELGKVAKWNNRVTVTDKEQMARDAYGVVNRAIDEAVEKGAKSIRSPELLKNLKDAKKLYSSTKSAEKLIENRLAREQGNKFFSISDYMLGAGGAPILGPKVLALVGAKKLMDRYGSQGAAIAFDKIGQNISKIPKIAEFMQKNPIAFQVAVYKIANDSGAKKPEDIKVSKSNQWLLNGLVNLSESGLDLSEGEKVNSLLQDSKKSEMIKMASSLKPNSKTINNLIAKIEGNK